MSSASVAFTRLRAKVCAVFSAASADVRVKEGHPKRSEAQRDTDSVAASQKEAPGWMSQSLTNVFTIALNATQDARGQSADGSTKPEPCPSPSLRPAMCIQRAVG